MSRRGWSLTELWIAVLVVGMIVDIGGTILSRMRKLVPLRQDPPAQLLDMAADRLRYDAVAGASVESGQLIAGRHHWSVSRGMLLRDGAPRCHVQRAQWTVEGRYVVIDIVPLREPAFRIEARRTQGAQP